MYAVLPDLIHKSRKGVMNEARVLQCPLQRFPPVKDVVDVLPKLKALAVGDRAVFERGMRAFVSFVQAYAKHECSLIFRLKGQCLLTCPCLFLLKEERNTLFELNL